MTNTSEVLVLTGGGYKVTAHEPICPLHLNKKKKQITMRKDLGSGTKACASCKPTWPNQKK